MGVEFLLFIPKWVAVARVMNERMIEDFAINKKNIYEDGLNNSLSIFLFFFFSLGCDYANS